MSRGGSVEDSGGEPAGWRFPVATLVSESISEVAVTRLRHAVTAAAGAAGLADSALEDFVWAVHELVTTSCDTAAAADGSACCVTP